MMINSMVWPDAEDGFPFGTRETVGAYRFESGSPPREPLCWDGFSLGPSGISEER